MRTCDIINELEDIELATRLRRAYIESEVDIERDSYNLSNVILGINWGTGANERYWNDQYTKAVNSYAKAARKSQGELLIEDDEDAFDEEDEYNEDDNEPDF